MIFKFSMNKLKKMILSIGYYENTVENQNKTTRKAEWIVKRNETDQMYSLRMQKMYYKCTG